MDALSSNLSLLCYDQALNDYNSLLDPSLAEEARNKLFTRAKLLNRKGQQMIMARRYQSVFENALQVEKNKIRDLDKEIDDLKKRKGLARLIYYSEPDSYYPFHLEEGGENLEAHDVDIGEAVWSALGHASLGKEIVSSFFDISKAIEKIPYFNCYFYGLIAYAGAFYYLEENRKNSFVSTLAKINAEIFEKEQKITDHKRDIDLLKNLLSEGESKDFFEKSQRGKLRTKQEICDKYKQVLKEEKEKINAAKTDAAAVLKDPSKSEQEKEKKKIEVYGKVTNAKYKALIVKELASLMASHLGDEEFSQEIAFYGEAFIELAYVGTCCIIGMCDPAVAIYTAIQVAKKIIDFQEADAIDPLQAAVKDLYDKIHEGFLITNENQRIMIHQLNEIIDSLGTIKNAIYKSRYEILNRLNKLEKSIQDFKDFYYEELYWEKQNALLKAFNELKLILTSHPGALPKERYHQLLNKIYSYGYFDANLPVFSGYTEKELELDELARRIRERGRVDLIFGLLGQISRELKLNSSVEGVANPTAWSMATQLFLAARYAAPELESSNYIEMIDNLYFTGRSILETLSIISEKKSIIRLLGSYEKELLSYDKYLKVNEVFANSLLKDLNEDSKKRGFDNPTIEYVNQQLGRNHEDVFNLISSTVSPLQVGCDYFLQPDKIAAGDGYFLYKVTGPHNPINVAKELKLAEEEEISFKTTLSGISPHFEVVGVRLKFGEPFDNFEIKGYKYTYSGGTNPVTLYKWELIEGTGLADVKNLHHWLKSRLDISPFPEYVDMNLKYKDHPEHCLNIVDFINHLLNIYITYQKKTTILKDLIKKIEDIQEKFESLNSKSLLLDVLLKINELSHSSYESFRLFFEIEDFSDRLKGICQQEFAKQVRKEQVAAPDPATHILIKTIDSVGPISFEDQVKQAYKTDILHILGDYKRKVGEGTTSGAWSFIQDTLAMLLGHAIQEDLPLKAFSGFKPSVFLKSYHPEQTYILLSEFLKIPSVHLKITNENWVQKLEEEIKKWATGTTSKTFLLSFSDTHYAVLHLHKDGLNADYIDMNQALLPYFIEKAIQPHPKKCNLVLPPEEFFRINIHLRVTYFLKMVEKIIIQDDSSNLSFKAQDVEMRKGQELRFLKGKSSSKKSIQSVVSRIYSFKPEAYFNPCEFSLRGKFDYYRATLLPTEGLPLKVTLIGSIAGLCFGGLAGFFMSSTNRFKNTVWTSAYAFLVLGISSLAIGTENLRDSRKIKLKNGVNNSDYAAALSAQNEYLWLKENENDILEPRAIALAKMGYYEHASRVVDKIIDLKDANKLKSTGDSLKNSNCYDLALKCYKELKLCDSQKLDYRKSLIETLEKLSRHTEALVELKEAVGVLSTITDAEKLELHQKIEGLEK